MKKVNIKSYLMGFAGGLMMLVVVSGTIAYAQNDDSGNSHWQKNPKIIEYKAEKLGMTVEELTSALESGKNFHEIAQEQGVDLSGFQKNHGGNHGKHSGKGNWSFDKGKHLAKFAEKLGMTEDELQAALDSGKTIQEIAEEQGVELKHSGKHGSFGRWHKDNNEE